MKWFNYIQFFLRPWVGNPQTSHSRRGNQSRYWTHPYHSVPMVLLVPKPEFSHLQDALERVGLLPVMFLRICSQLTSSLAQFLPVNEQFDPARGWKMSFHKKWVIFRVKVLVYQRVSELKLNTSIYYGILPGRSCWVFTLLGLWGACT